MKVFKSNKKLKKGAIVAIVLVVATIILTATTVFANNQYLYVEDITMATGTNEAEVIKQLTDAGYTVAKRNLCDGNGQYAYLGYKTTTDIEDAITDIRLMNMSSGFKMMDYRALQTAYNIQLTSMAKQFMATVKEMKSNVEKKSPLALAGKSLLDLFYYETMEGEHIPFSEYLFDDSRTLQNFIDLNMMCNTLTLSIISNALNLGVDDGKLVDVGTKFENYEVITEDDGNSFATLDKMYSEYAQILSDEIVLFADNYQKGAVNVQVAPEVTNASVKADMKETYKTDVTQSFAADYSDEYVDALEESEKEDSNLPLYDAVTSQSENELVENDDNYVLFVALYEVMKDYSLPEGLDGTKYGNPQNLAEYLIGYADAVRNKTELSNNDLRYLYPLIASFTDGQRYVVKLSGIISMMLYLVDPSEKQDLKLEIENKIKNDYLPAIKEIQDKDNIDSDYKVNIFVGTNVNAYNKQVALTEKGNRVAAASAQYDKITVGESNTIKNLKKALTIAKICVYAAAGITILALVGFGIACGTFSIIAAITLVAIGGSWLVGGMAVAGMICAVFSVVFAVILVIAVVAFLIIAIWKWILEKEEEKKANTPATYSTIPDEVYDYVNSDTEYRFVGYEAVRDPSGKIADINNYKSINAKSQWDVFYFSKDEAAGSPIIVEKLNPESLFTFSTDKFTAEKQMPLCRFGEKFATNVRNYQNKITNNTLYMFFKTEKSVDGEEGGTVQEQGCYLQTLKVYSNKDSEAAKLFLIKSGYELIEKNLTPGTDMYTYIGFTTTSRAHDAIRDIRVAYGAADENGAFQFGSYSYGCAGITSNSIGIYYSSIEGVGTPIYADLTISDNKDAEKDNYEPVNLFSGGDAFDFCTQKDLKKEKWNNHVYIYFNPTEKFDSNSIFTKKYVDGFAFFITDSTGSSDVESLMELNGFETFKVNSKNGNYYSNQKDICNGATSVGNTYMAVSKTANPYRAITDIATYDASQPAKMLFENMQVAGQGYSVCETFMQYSNKRTIRLCNAYVCGEYGENGPNYYPEKITDAAYLTKKVINEEGEFDDIIYKGVYVKGPCKDTEPLTPDDIFFTEDSQTVSGYRAVTNLDDGYGTKARNIVCEYKKPSYTYFTPFRQTIPSLTRYTAQKCTFSHHLYIHIKGEQVTKGKYISDIFVTSFDSDTIKDASDGVKRMSDDYAISSALANFGRCEIRRTNLVANNGKQSYTKTDSGIVGADYYGNTSYVCIKYTNNINEALRNIVAKCYKDKDSLAPNTIDVDNVEFSKCGDVVYYHGIINYAYLYQSKNAFYGNPIVDIKCDVNTLDNVYVPVLSDEGRGAPVGNSYVKYLRYTVKSGDNITESPRYIKKLVFTTVDKNLSVSDKTYYALYSLYTMYGCTNYINYNRNAYKNDGSCIYFGYTTTTDLTDKNIITSIICSHDYGTAGQQRTYNGITYTCVSDYDLSADGSGSYLYVSTDKRANPISTISLLNGTSVYNSGTPSENYCVDTISFDSNNDNGFKIRYYPSNYWSYKKGVLTVRCHGDMPDYNDSYPAPWAKYAASITDVVIESLVTSIDADAFKGCTSIKTIKIENDSVANGYKDITIQDGAIPEGVTITANINSKGVTDYINRNTESNNNVLYYNLSGTCHNNNFTYELDGNKLTIKGSGVLGDDGYTTVRKKVYLDGSTTGSFKYINTSVKNHKYNYATYTPWGEGLSNKVSGIDLSSYFKNITELEIIGDTTSIATDFFKSLSSLKKITVKSISGTGFDKAFGTLNGVECYGYLDSGFRQYAVSNGLDFHYIASQCTPTTAKKTAEQWEISGNTLIIKKNGTYKNKGTDDSHTNSEYTIDKSVIKRVLIFNTVKALPADSFNGYTNLKEIIVVSDVDNLTTTDSNGKALVAPVTAIPDRCFKDCASLSAYEISSKITSIGAEAFSGCTNLSQISLPTAVKSVSDKAFVGCKDGFTLTVNNASCAISSTSTIVDKNAIVVADMNTNAYGSAMITGCSFTMLNPSKTVGWKLNADGKLTVTESAKTVTWNNLKDYIKSVEITSDVKTMPDNSFSGYTGITKVTLSSSLEEIPDNFCMDCKSLVTLVIPNGVKKIGDCAFKNCEKLDFIGDDNRKSGAVAYVFPSSIKEIGDYAFNGIYDEDGTTAGISLPLNVKKIGDKAFFFKNTFITTYSDDCEYGDLAVVTKSLHFSYNTESKTYKYKDENFNRIKSEYGISMYQTTISDYEVDGNTIHFTGGFLESYADSSLAPWNNISVENVVFDSFIILSKGCFFNNKNIKTVKFCNMNGVSGYRVVFPQDSFRNCTNLKSVVAEDRISVVSYGVSSFMNCTSLTFGNSMPKGVETIGNFAFDGCGNLFTGDVVMPETLEEIGSSAFSCSNTITMYLPKNLKKICNLGIYCPNWTVVLSSPDTQIITNAIYARAVYSPEYQNAVEFFNKIKANKMSNKYASMQLNFIAGWEYEAGILTISGNHDMYDYPNKSLIPWYAFKDEITTVNVEDGVTSICQYAFSDLTNLNELNIADSVVLLENYCLENLSLDSIELYGDNTTAQSNLIFGDKKTDSVTISCKENSQTYSNLTSLGYKIEGIPEESYSFTTTGVLNIFYCNAKSEAGWKDIRFTIKSVVLDDSIKTIPKGAFADYTSLTSVTLPSGLTSIPDEAFKNCTALKNISIPKSVTKIGDSAFENCSSLNLCDENNCYAFNNAITYIGSKAFYGVMSDKECYISLPHELSFVGSDAICMEKAELYMNNSTTVFDDNSLTCYIVYAPCYLTGFDYAWYNYDKVYDCYRIAEWNFENNILTIGGYYDMPDYKNIGAVPWQEYADSIEKIVVAEGVQVIGSYAFNSLPNLKSITLPSTLNAICSNSLCNLGSVDKIYLASDNITSVADDMLGSSKTSIEFTNFNYSSATWSTLTNKGFKVTYSTAPVGSVFASQTGYVIVTAAIILVIAIAAGVLIRYMRIRKNDEE